MGKNQHSKDRLYLTRTEHASGEHRGAGKQSALRLPYKTLPYDCCAISFRPFETPLCTDDGIVFELLNIVPFLKKFRRHPVTGAPLAASDLTKLHFHKNTEGQYQCPVLYKSFTQHTHIVAIKTTGNVYCYDAVKQMNLKTNHLRDLLDETPFTRADVIHVQDPTNAERRELERFNHVNAGLEVDLKDSGGVRHNEATARIMQQVSERSAASTPSGVATKLTLPKPPKPTATGPAGGSSSGGGPPAARWVQTTGAASSSLTSTSVPVQTVNEIAPLSEEEASRQRCAARRLCSPAGREPSTACSPAGCGLPEPARCAPHSPRPARARLGDLRALRALRSTNPRRPLLWPRYAFVRAQKAKGYVQLRTSHGILNLELHVDVCPRTCDNFLQLVERGYYDNIPFHRLIRNFMLQGGDPTGTGNGGESCWGGKFADEISNKLRHEGRGVLSMANAGPNTNGSQFFITFKSAAHLDGKHTVFGRVVGGLDALAALESLKTDKDDRPLEPVTLLGASAFVNPFADVEARMEEAHAKKADPAAAAAEEDAKKAAEDGQAWFNHAESKPKAHRPGIGKYIAPQLLPAAVPAAAEAAAGPGGSGSVGGRIGGSSAALGGGVGGGAFASDDGAAAREPPKKKPKGGGGFGNFDGW